MPLPDRNILTLRDFAEPETGWPVIADDDPLLMSIQALGIRQPIQIASVDGQWHVVDGKRRVAALRMLGRYEAPVTEIETNDADTLLDSVVVNTVRRPGRRSEIIRLMRALHLRGPRHVAEALGLEEKRARVLLRMTGLADQVLDQLARDEANQDNPDLTTYSLPTDQQLCAIAMATPETQVAALDRVREDEGDVDWFDLADALQTRRIPRSAALFDPETSGIPWQEDLFAQADDEDRFTTSDIDAFARLQQQAIVALLATKRPKTAWHFAAWNPHGQGPTIPDGLRVVSQVLDIKTAEHVKNTQVYVTVALSGPKIGRPVAYRVEAAAKPGAKPTPEPDDDEPAGDDEADDTAPPAAPTPQPEADINPVTKAGREIIVERKNQALRAAFASIVEPVNWRRIAAMLCLAFRGDNVHVRGTTLTNWHRHEADLIDPAGQLTLPDDATLARVALDTLAQVVRVDPVEVTTYNVGSGRIAEWIGHAINATGHLPRFDDPIFLAQVKGDELKAAAESGDFGKLPPKVGDLRKALEGKLPHWHPPGAHFGHAGPQPYDTLHQTGEAA